MYEKDYVLRMATLAAQVLAKLLGLKRAGQYKEALALVDQTLREEMGPSLDLVDQLSATELILMVKSGLALDIPKAMFLAALLKEEGDILAAENKTAESRQAYTKGLQVALKALDDADTATCREHLELIDELTDLLGRTNVDRDARDALHEYYQRIGETKRARDVLSGLPG